ncbi:MAG: hypothetical protein ACTSPB_00780 [Candidatus Thorarchaeota archaeon]
MARRGKGSGWFGDHRRHVLAGKGVSTKLPDGRRLDVSKFVAGGEPMRLVTGEKVYPMAQEHFWKYAIRDKGKGYKTMGIMTNEFRPPKKGEFYVSGAIPEVYEVPNDLSTSFYIIKLIHVSTETVYKAVED